MMTKRWRYELALAGMLMSIGMRRSTSWSLAVWAVSTVECLAAGVAVAVITIGLVFAAGHLTAPVNQDFPQADIREVPYGL